LPHHDIIKTSGKIVDVFHHRFVLETPEGRMLADVTPRGLEQFSLSVGGCVEIEGEQKPSEIKVLRFARAGRSFEIEQEEKHGSRGHHKPHTHGDADPNIALGAARDEGYEILAGPRREPKHFEILGKRKGKTIELHVELDGCIRKEKPGSVDDEKWAMH
jgi:hypothetical protein